jgi:hypothetical protein
LRSQNGVFCEIFRVNQIFLNAFAEKRYFKEVPLSIKPSASAKLKLPLFDEPANVAKSAVLISALPLFNDSVKPLPEIDPPD